LIRWLSSWKANEKFGIMANASVNGKAKGQHGGQRIGSGRPRVLAPGVRDLRNDVYRLRERWGIMPLDYMLKVLNTEKETDERKMWACEHAAPYLHSKLASIEIVQGEAPVRHEVDLTKLSMKELDQLEALVDKASKKTDEITLDDTQYNEVKNEGG
jgi:hypothetical protein